MGFKTSINSFFASPCKWQFLWDRGKIFFFNEECDQTGFWTLRKQQDWDLNRECIQTWIWDNDQAGISTQCDQAGILALGMWPALALKQEYDPILRTGMDNVENVRRQKSESNQTRIQALSKHWYYDWSTGMCTDRNLSTEHLNRLPSKHREWKQTGIRAQNVTQTRFSVLKMRQTGNVTSFGAEIQVGWICVWPDCNRHFTMCPSQDLLSWPVQLPFTNTAATGN